jgi:hypothetical protein
MHSVAATVREIASNAGPGRYLEADRVAASFDVLAMRRAPGALRKILTSPESPALAQQPSPEQYLAALTLLSRYEENGYYRRVTGRYLSRLDPESAEAGAVAGVLGIGWPGGRRPADLFSLCLALVRGEVSDPALEPLRRNRSLPWEVMGDLMRSQPLTFEGTDETWDAMVRQAFAAVPGALQDAAAPEAAAVAWVLSIPDLADEFVTDEALFGWVGAGDNTLTEACARALARRGRFAPLAERAMGMDAEKQLVALGALADPDGDVHTFRSPEQGVETDFWVHCARTQPARTVFILLHGAPDGRGSVGLGRAIYRPLREFLAAEAERGSSPPGRVTETPGLDLVAAVVEAVGAWREQDDVPLFQRLLNHPGYLKSLSRRSESDPWSERRRYLVRESAKTVLVSMGLPVGDGVILEETVPIPAPPGR